MDQGPRRPLQFVLGLFLTVIFFYMLAPFLLPLLLGGIFALLMYPAYTQLRRRKFPKGAAALICVLGLAGGVLIPLGLVGYGAVYRISGLISKLKVPTDGPSLTQMLGSGWMERAFSSIERWFPVDREWLHSQSLEVSRAALEWISKLAASSLAGVPALLLGFFIVIVATFFFLVDGQRFLRFLSSISPLGREKSEQLYDTFERTCRGVVLGLFASALAQAALMSIFLVITGVPNAAILGMLTIFAAMIPVFGSAPVVIGSVIYLFMKGKAAMAIVMIIGGILVASVDNVIRPWVMKGSAEMHPLLALLSALGAVGFMGAPGIFLGPVIAAVFVAFLKMLSQELETAP